MTDTNGAKRGPAVTWAPYEPPAPATHDEDSPAGGAAARSDLYVVSLPKFFALAIATGGLYIAYWFYAQSRILPAASRPWRVLAATMSVLFVHGLFPKFDSVALDAGLGPRRTTGYAWPYTCLWFAQIAAVLAAKHTAFASLVGLLFPLPTIVLLGFVQHQVNRIAGDELGASNRRFTVVNCLVIALGICVSVAQYPGLLPTPVQP